jgi:hypothetical protein
MISSYSISPEITNTPGLSFSTSTGLISGIPTQASTARTYTITATNAFGSATRTFRLTVTAAITTSASQSEIDAAALAAQKASEAKREAEKQAARNEILNSVKTSQDVNHEMFTKAEISGVTAANIAAVQTEISALPQSSRVDLSQVLKIARKYEVVRMVASDQVASLHSDSFIEIGLIPEGSKHKAALTAAIKKLPASERSTYEAIKAAIDAELAEIRARSNRSATILALIASRRAG